MRHLEQYLWTFLAVLSSLFGTLRPLESQVLWMVAKWRSKLHTTLSKRSGCLEMLFWAQRLDLQLISSSISNSKNLSTPHISYCILYITSHFSVKWSMSFNHSKYLKRITQIYGKKVAFIPYIAWPAKLACLAAEPKTEHHGQVAEIIGRDHDNRFVLFSTLLLHAIVSSPKSNLGPCLKESSLFLLFQNIYSLLLFVVQVCHASFRLFSSSVWNGRLAACCSDRNS